MMDVRSLSRWRANSQGRRGVVKTAEMLSVIGSLVAESAVVFGVVGRTGASRRR